MLIIPNHKSIAKLFDENFRENFQDVPVAKSGEKEID
jgi:hypothetical protein